MKKFEIRYEETMVGFFDVEAENEEEAIEKFWELAEEGKDRSARYGNAEQHGRCD